MADCRFAVFTARVSRYNLNCSNFVEHNAKVWSIIGAGLAAGVGIFWWVHKDDPGSLPDQIADAIVTLTTSEETRLSNMQADAQAAARSLIQDLANQGITAWVGQTLRSPAQEKAAVDSGHSAVTTVSWHQLGRAVDLYPTYDDGSADTSGNNMDAIRAIATTAENWGFRQLAFNADGSKRIIHTATGAPIWDSGHVEFRSPYSTIAEAVAAEGAAFGLA
jgi:hypothetical protein